jgi:GT2 family glycosyltransferase
METEKVGIVTVLYKSETVLEDFFRTLNDQTYKNFVLYVIDNKSPDDSLNKSKDLAESVCFETIFIENDDNYGVAKGNNQGIEAALKDGCDYVLLSNNDVVLEPDTIEKLYVGLMANNADMAVPKIYFYGTNLIWAAGGKFTKYNGSVKHIGVGKNDIGQYNKNNKIDYSPTCFMLIRSDVFFTVGMMDEKYFVYFDDVDFIYRAKKKKQELFYIYNSIVQHKESTSTGGSKSDFFLHYNTRNKIYFAKKHRLFYRFFLIEELIYHYLIRRLKLDQHCWDVMTKALYDGTRM